MDKKLLQTLRKLIESEVRKQLPSLLKEYDLPKKKSSKYSLTSSMRDTLASITENIQEEKTPIKIEQKRNPPIVTKNPLLNEIFSKTRGGISNDMGTQYEYGNLMGKEAFTSGDVGMFTGGHLPVTTGLETGRQLDTQTPEGEAVAKALTRDYRDLVKRFKK
jgi:hypothetical protein